MATALPVCWFFYVLPAVMRVGGQGPEVIGLVSLVYLPYALRAVWAIGIDRLTRGDPGRCRRVVLGSVIAALIGTGLMSLADPLKDIVLLLACGTAIFVCLATGATALDAYLLARLEQEARKQAAAWQCAGFTFGGMMLGLGAWVLDGVLDGAPDGASWRVTVGALVAATALAALPVLSLPQGGAIAPQTDRGPARAAGRGFLRRPGIRRRLAVSLFAQSGLGMMAGYLPVYQVDSGMTPGQVGLFGAIGSNALGLVAAVLAGAALARTSGWLLISAILAAGAGLFLTAAALHGPLHGPVFATSLSLMALMLGYGYLVPFRALAYQAATGPRPATEAAILYSIDVTLSILAASLAGLVVVSLGLTAFFTLSAALCLCGMLLAARAPRRFSEGYPAP